MLYLVGCNNKAPEDTTSTADTGPTVVDDDGDGFALEEDCDDTDDGIDNDCDTTLNICGGTWYTRLKLNHSIAMIGAGAGSTILDASLGGSVISTTAADTTIAVEGVTLTYGSGEEGPTPASMAAASIAVAR